MNFITVTMRFYHCSRCEFFNKKKSICTQCGCYMKAKALLPFAKCPLNKWDEQK